MPVCGLGWGWGVCHPRPGTCWVTKNERAGRVQWSKGERSPWMLMKRGRGREQTCLQGVSEAVTVGTRQSPATQLSSWNSGRSSASSLGQCRASEPRLDLLSQSLHLDKVTGGFCAQSSLRSADETPLFQRLPGMLSVARTKIQPRLVQA